MTNQKIRLEDIIWWRLLKQTAAWMRTLLITIMLMALLAGIGILYLKSRPLPPPDLHATTQLYDEQGKLMDEITGDRHQKPILLHQVPQQVIQATLAAEDHGFYQHMGFSLSGIARATWVNLRSGEIEQGASTITQQLARNLYLTHDRTWTRKLKEAMLTVQLELHYSKAEILEMYLNEIYYGHGAYGIGRAAQQYFQKGVQELNLAEAAFLAGLPRGPSHYSPYFHLTRAKKRQASILKQMAHKQIISTEEAKQATHTPIAVRKSDPPSSNNIGYYRDYVLQEAIHQLGLEESLVKHGGLQIYTTLDPELQKKAEKTVKHRLAPYNDLQGALLSVDPHTGHIKAMVGGKNYRQSQFNRILAKRQPGSSFKPFLYLSALENGYTPLTQIMSRPTSFWYDNQLYQPSNFRNHYPNRRINLREAIALSDNIYAVSTIFQIGMDKGVEMAKRLGITSPLAETPSLALGSYAVSPYEMTEAYTTLAAQGIHRPLQTITKIVDRDGTVLVDRPTAGKRVVDPAHSFLLTHLLTSVFDSGGTGHRIQQIVKQPVAGKTGTTDWDGWLVGYTPNLVTTVWVGYDQNQKLSHEQARLSQYIWGSFMREAFTRYPAKPFIPPKGVKKVQIDEETGQLATAGCKQVKTEYFQVGTEPLSTCPLHHDHPPQDSDHTSLWKRLLQWWRQQE